MNKPMKKQLYFAIPTTVNKYNFEEQKMESRPMTNIEYVKQKRERYKMELENYQWNIPKHDYETFHYIARFTRKNLNDLMPKRNRNKQTAVIKNYANVLMFLFENPEFPADIETVLDKMYYPKDKKYISTLRLHGETQAVKKLIKSQKSEHQGRGRLQRKYDYFFATDCPKMQEIFDFIFRFHGEHSLEINPLFAESRARWVHENRNFLVQTKLSLFLTCTGYNKYELGIAYRDWLNNVLRSNEKDLLLARSKVSILRCIMNYSENIVYKILNETLSTQKSVRKGEHAEHDKLQIIEYGQQYYLSRMFKHFNFKSVLSLEKGDSIILFYRKNPWDFPVPLPVNIVGTRRFGDFLILGCQNWAKFSEDQMKSDAYRRTRDFSIAVDAKEEFYTYKESREIVINTPEYFRKGMSDKLLLEYENVR